MLEQRTSRLQTLQSEFQEHAGQGQQLDEKAAQLEKESQDLQEKLQKAQSKKEDLVGTLAKKEQEHEELLVRKADLNAELEELKKKFRCVALQLAHPGHRGCRTLAGEKMVLKTKLTEALGIKHPIIQGGLTMIEFASAGRAC
eukprot:s855_g15.t1